MRWLLILQSWRFPSKLKIFIELIKEAANSIAAVITFIVHQGNNKSDIKPIFGGKNHFKPNNWLNVLRFLCYCSVSGLRGGAGFIVAGWKNNYWFVCRVCLRGGFDKRSQLAHFYLLSRSLEISESYRMTLSISSNFCSLFLQCFLFSTISSTFFSEMADSLKLLNKWTRLPKQVGKEQTIKQKDNNKISIRYNFLSKTSQILLKKPNNLRFLASKSQNKFDKFT